MKTLITYTKLPNRNTRDVLRHINDMTALREHTDLCWTVMEQQRDPEYTRIWNYPSRALPKKTVVPGKVYDLQTPREFIEGFKEKINRTQGNDLSKKVCDGFALFSSWFSEEFGTDYVVFADKDDLINAANLTMFEVTK
jgi:hypothetical protein